MVAGAAEMMARRGVSATSVREVVRSTGTPRGSIAHHFPGGRQQLIEEAVAFAGNAIAQPLQRLMQERGALDGMNRFIDLWRQALLASNFEAGCPVLAVCMEGPLSGEPGPTGNLAPAEQARLLDIAHGVFTDWQQLLADALRRDGLKPARAKRLAALIVASVEGTVAMCRASRSAKPLDDVQAELHGLVETALG